jgi:hypothetical protein
MGERERKRGASCVVPLETGDGLVDPFSFFFFGKTGGLVDLSHRTWAKI